MIAGIDLQTGDLLYHGPDGKLYHHRPKEKAMSDIRTDEATNTTHFKTGAIRSAERAKVRYDLITPIGLRRVAETYHEGSAKYGDYNWEKGMPINDLLNHAIAHIYDYLSGDRSEDHLAHAAWGLLASIHSEESWPELNTNLRPIKPSQDILGNQSLTIDVMTDAITQEKIDIDAEPLKQTTTFDGHPPFSGEDEYGSFYVKDDVVAGLYWVTNINGESRPQLRRVYPDLSIYGVNAETGNSERMKSGNLCRCLFYNAARFYHVDHCAWVKPSFLFPISSPEKEIHDGDILIGNHKQNGRVNSEIAKQD